MENTMDTRVVRKQWGALVLLVGAGLAFATGCKREDKQQGAAAVKEGAAPSSGDKTVGPVTINVMDAAGTLQLVQEAIEAFKTKYTGRADKVTFNKAPAPELPGKLKAMQAGRRMDIDLVLGGTGILAAGDAHGV